MQLPRQLDAQLKSAFAKVDEIAASLPPPQPGLEGARRQAELGRFYWNEGGPTLARLCEQTVTLSGGEVRAVLYVPEMNDQRLPAFVYLHGGGFKFGTRWSNDRQMREIAQAWGGIVVSIEYPLAPEAVFPKAIDVTAEFLRWLHVHGAQWGIDGDRLSVGGTSAGASIAFGAIVSLQGAPWLMAAVGIVGAFSDDITLPSMIAFTGMGLFPERMAIAAMFDEYAPLSEHRRDPRLNLLAAPSQVFPPVFLAIAELDTLRDASVRLAMHLSAGQQACELRQYPGMSHLFFGFSREVGQAAQCVSDVSAFLTHHLPA